MGKASKASSGEATSLPLGDEPKTDLDAAKAAEEAELAAMLAEEEAKLAAQGKADPVEASDAKLAAEKAAELEALSERKDPIRTAEPRLVTKDADSADEEPLHGPRVQVWPHGSVDWDGASYEANREFTVDTAKHSENAFLGLVAAGALIRLD